MNKTLLNLLRYGILTGILLFGGWYISTHFAQFSEKVQVTPGAVALLVFLNLCTILLESARLRIMIRKLGCDMGQAAAWNMMTLIQAVNHVILKAGTFSGGYYISRRYGISFNSYVAFVMTYVVVMVLASGVLGLAVTALFQLSGASVNPYLPLFFLLVIASAAGCLAAARIRLVFSWLPPVLLRFFEAIRFIYSDYRMLFLLLGIEVLYYAATALRFMVAFSMFSGHTDFLSAVAVVTVGNFLRIATIVPGGHRYRGTGQRLDGGPSGRQCLTLRPFRRAGPSCLYRADHDLRGNRISRHFQPWRIPPSAGTGTPTLRLKKVVAFHRGLAKIIALKFQCSIPPDGRQHASP